MDNPLRFIDPDGMEATDVFLKGNKAKDALKQLQSSTSLKLSRDEKTGQVTATGTAKTTSDKKLQAAIDDHSVKIEMTASDNKKSSDGSLLVVDAFEGTTYSKNGGKGSATVNHEINTESSEKVDAYEGTPGGVIEHAITEDYAAQESFQLANRQVRLARRRGLQMIQRQYIVALMSRQLLTRQPTARAVWTFMMQTEIKRIDHMLQHIEHIFKRAKSLQLKFGALMLDIKRIQMRRGVITFIFGTLISCPNFSCNNKGNKVDVIRMDSTSKVTAKAACKIYKIDSINDYYLIYIVKGKDRYKVISKISMRPGYDIVKLGKTYDLQITYVFGSIAGGVFKPSCLDVDAKTKVCLEDSIVDLCYAENLNGLYIDNNK